MLTLFEVALSYGKKSVLENISFEVKKGECVVVLGTNGTGKSTLIKAIARLHPLSKGEMSMDGIPVRQIKPATYAQKIAYVPQQVVFPTATVYDTILVGRRPYMSTHTTQADHTIVKDIIKQLGLTNMAFAYVTQLSGGEQQKVALARALAQEPDLLLLDEPTANLDLKNQVAFVSLVRELMQQGGIGVLVSMHDVNMAMALGDAFVLLKDGQILAKGKKDILTPSTLSAVYDTPLTFLQNGDSTFIVPQNDT